MAHHFDANNAPFDRLSREEARCGSRCARHRLFPPGGDDHRAATRRPTACSSSSRARVEERDHDEVVALRGPGDAFDSRALVQGSGSNAFVAREETLCNLLPRDVDACASSIRTGASRRSSTSTSRASSTPSRRRKRRRVFAAAWTRVSAIFSFTCDVHGRERVNRQRRRPDEGLQMITPCLVMEDAELTGILTRSDLVNATIVNRQPIDEPGRAPRAPSDHLRRTGDLRLDCAIADDQAQQAARRSCRRTASSWAFWRTSTS